MSGHYPLYFKFQNCDHLSDSKGLHYFQSLAPIVCSEYSRRLTCERAQGCWVGVVGCRVLCNFFCLGFQKGSGYLSSLCLVGSLLVNFCKKRYTFFFFFLLLLLLLFCKQQSLFCSHDLVVIIRRMGAIATTIQLQV